MSKEMEATGAPVVLVPMVRDSDGMRGDVHPYEVENYRVGGWRVVVTTMRDQLDAALSALPDGNTDPDYVVRAMRAHFGDVFVDEDEKLVRERVIAPVKKPSDGLKVDELKAALKEKGIEIPEDAKKADLAALLDAAPVTE